MRHKKRLQYDGRGPSDSEVAFGYPKQIPPFGPKSYRPKKTGEPSLSEVPRPAPWKGDNLLSLSNFTTGVERDVIGGASPEVPSPGPVPLGMRGTIDFFHPVALDAFGNQVHALLNGTVVLWRLYANNRPLRGFEVYGVIPGMREQFRRSVGEIYAGETIRVTIQVVTNGMLLSQLGVRIWGTWVPIVEDRSRGRRR